MKNLFSLIACACSAFVIGCTQDPFVGYWEGQLNPSANLTIESDNHHHDYVGHGNIYFTLQDEGYVLCTLEMAGYKSGTNEMTTSFRLFKDSVGCPDGVVDNIKCNVYEESDTMTCKIPGGTIIAYYKVE